MRKLKKFDLRTNQILTKEEMSKLCGMEFISFYCTQEGAPCALYANGGVNTGICKWLNYSTTEKRLSCVAN